MFDIISGRMNCYYAATATITHLVLDFLKKQPFKIVKIILWQDKDQIRPTG